MSRSESQMGQIGELVGEEGTLVSGALAMGGTMSAALHQQSSPDGAVRAAVTG